MPKSNPPITGSPGSKAASSTDRFVHLHLHTEYSLLDGGITVRRLIDRVKDLGMDSVAVTDHGNLHAAIEFHDAARAAGIKPILGIEAYVAQGDRKDRTHTGVKDGGFHLVLLAETIQGWRNLLKLSSDSYVNGFYYKPRMDKSTLEQWSEGLIAINGHLGSSMAFHLERYVRDNSETHWEAALEEARWHKETFGTNEAGDPCFFVELQRHIPEQEAINPHLKRIAEIIDAPIVVDNDAHFLLQEDHDVHDTLCCISMSKMKDENDRIRYPEGLYVKSPAEMAELFHDEPEAIANTVRIADRCSVDLTTDENHAPVVKVVHPGIPPKYDGGDLTDWFKSYCSSFELLPFDAEKEPEISASDLKDGCDQALRDLCEAGLLWRYGPEGITPKIRERLERELRILADKLISAYFLIVWDFVNWARQNGIPTNARGSGVGTMVGYVLGLSNACPERYGLLFERFTDPDRAEYPDIDIDMCQDGRGDCIDYVKKKYGHVAQIITYGRLKARNAIKDVARVMGLPPHEGQRLANLVPSELDITIDDALQREPKLRDEYKTNPSVARVIDHAKALEGHARHSSVHAAGVVIATQPLDTIVPLLKPSGSDDIVTQWDGPTCERRGLLKMDFLGLRTLSTIELAKKLVRESLDEDEIWRTLGEEPPKPGDIQDQRSHPLDLDRLVYDDQKVFDLFSRADTDGVFQFESAGMRRLLIELQPDRLEDLIAANALYRPGPMDLIDDFVARKHGRQAVPEVNEIVDRYTAETYGIMIYQEQVMQVLHHLGGIPLREAYTIIKAISKKNHQKIDAARAGFLSGSSERGMDKSQADDLFELILKFAGYGFNKSHSTGYAIIAYQTAYLKSYFPAQAMTALLTFESQKKKVEEWAGYMEGCRRVPWPDSTPEHPHVGIDVRPPDVNLSATDFSVVFDEGELHDASSGHIRFGLGAIKGVGRDAIQSITVERERDGFYKSVFDFCERVDHRRVNSKTIELLIKSGTFDSIHGIDARSSMIETIPDAVGAGKQLAHDRAVGQEVLFGAAPDTAEDGPLDIPLRQAVPWDRMTTLNLEKETLGFHVSGHPLDEYSETIREFCNASAHALADLQQGSRALLGATVTRIRPTVTKRGDRMAMLTIEDKFGSADAVLFPEAFTRCEHMIEKDRILLFSGSVDLERANPSLKIDHAFEIEEASQHLATCMEVLIEDRSEPETVRIERLRALSRTLADAASTPREGHAVPPLVRIDVDGSRVTLRTQQMAVVPTTELVRNVESIVGPGCVRVVGGFQPPAPPRPQRGRPRRFD